VEEKKSMVEPENHRLSISRQCELLRLPRASFYRETRIDETPENLLLMEMIDEEYTAHPHLGSRGMRRQLKRAHGVIANRKRIQRLMRLMGLESTAPKPNTSKPAKGHKIYPYLLRHRPVTKSNQVWCSDITYIRMARGFVYMVAIMDWYSRKVLAWDISVTMDSSFCVRALEQAIHLYGTPEIFNTDQGAQFTASDFIDVLEKNDVLISMNGKGRALDNIFVERLWRTVKYEEVYLHDYADMKQLRENMKRYMHFYNYERSHSQLNDCTPDEVYQQNELADAA
jgi:putative transposase